MEIAEPNLELAPGWERVVYAENQPPYLPLPVVRSQDDEVRVVSRWTPTPAEREQIARGADVFVTVLTFGGPLQAQLVTIGGASIVPVKPRHIVSNCALGRTYDEHGRIVCPECRALFGKPDQPEWT